jgi:hypothetical protein
MESWSWREWARMKLFGNRHKPVYLTRSPNLLFERPSISGLMKLLPSLQPSKKT